MNRVELERRRNQSVTSRAQSWWRFGLRQTWRDARSGELRLLLFAVMIAVAAITSVGFLADRVSQALNQDAVRLLGADLLVESPQAAQPAWVQAARDQGLAAIRIQQFPSMVGSSDGLWQLASVKAVEEGYPLRGALRTAESIDTPDAVTEAVPEVGTVWIDPQLLLQTGLSVGEDLQVGHSALTIARVLTYEPDRGMQLVSMAPRLLMRAEDLQATGLLAAGSRVGHSLMVAGESDALANFRDWLEPQLQTAQKILDVQEGRPEVGRTVERAQNFLTLVVMIAVLISAVSIALGARRFAQRQQQAIAVMRCLGATRGLIRRVLLVEFSCVALLGTVLGVVIGAAAQLGLAITMQSLVMQSLPAPSWMPVLQGVYAGFWLLFAFSLPPLQSLSRMSPAQIFRQETAGLAWQSISGYGLAIGGFFGLMWWIAGDLLYGLGLAAGFVAAAALFAGLTLAMLQAFSWFRKWHRGHATWRFAMAGMVRRRGATMAQVSALAGGMMAILLLLIVRTDLLDGWQQTLPPDAANRFLINIQPDQIADVRVQLQSLTSQPAQVYPMVRGRLIEHNDNPIRVDDYRSPRIQRLLQRDFNLTYLDSLQNQGQVVAGEAWDPQTLSVSIEDEIARELGLRLGDQVTFDVAGLSVPVQVTQFRKVDWGTLKPNFFAITTPQALQNSPQTWMTAIRLEQTQQSELKTLLQTYPNITVFDVDALMNQLRSVLDRVVFAIQGLFVFAVLAGGLVLMAALSTSRDERVREAALLRALGATDRQLRSAQRLELLTIGALAGLMASAGATTIAWGLSRWVFEFAMVWSWLPWVTGLVVCMVAAWVAGSLVLRGVLQTPPLQILRTSL
ncbi:ABC transporter permease [Orrella sp. 11846]|uniref:ABC transporter permease n=1 Tax=Orrella sp. 11846 TaxID=3409913 RepID=UPI003B5BC88C